MKMDEATTLLDHINHHEGPKHPGFMLCEVRSLEPPTFAYTFDSPKHATAFLLFQRTQGVIFRLEHDPAHESVILEQR
ncbi:MAG: hypothetical protein MUE68_03985 [Bacteroidetes bacterium]|jgi:hypothetical protein|nr:hypothetical protein [Bacteroidota bacterium]